MLDGRPACRVAKRNSKKYSLGHTSTQYDASMRAKIPPLDQGYGLTSWLLT